MRKNQKIKLKKTFKNKKNLGIVVFIFLAFLIQLPARHFVSQKISDRGNYYFNGGEYDLKKAESLYQKALVFNQKNWEAHYQLGRINLINSKFQGGISEIDKALAVDPENKRAYYVRGLLNGYAHNYTEAEKDFQNFIAFAPHEWAGYMDLSWVYINSEKYEDAVKTTSNALVLFPDNIWLYANKGLAEYKSGKYEESKTSLGIAKKLAKNLTSDDWAKAYPGNNSGDAEKGVEEIKTAIDYNFKLAYEATENKDEADDIDVNLAYLGWGDAVGMWGIQL
jgi:tetratricopeptide (TPR) repeat protein